MSFYSDASVVMIPSGYKTSKVYCAVPTDGAADLTFTRSNDTASRIGPNGLLEKVRTNLVLQSEAFNTTWGATGASVTANTTANPLNGALTADTITLDAGTSGKNVSQNFSQNGVFTQSVYLKAGTHQFVQLLLGDDIIPRANFDLVNGTATATSSTASIVSVGNGWFRCSMSYTTSIGSVVYLWAVDSLAATRAESTASTGTFFAFGFQLESGDIATDYIATTTAAVSVGPVANVPRLDYLNSSCPRLLLEPQRTNAQTFSEDFSQGKYTKTDCTISSNVTATEDPAGYNGSDKLVEAVSVGGQHYVFFSAQTGANQETQISIFAKAAGRTEFLLWESAITNAQARFNLNNGTISASSSGNVDNLVTTTPTITSYGNGWYRCTLNFKTAAGGGTVRVQLYNGSTSYNGNGTDGIFIYGLQEEVNTAYATSYIPTLGAAVTRGADAASKTGISSLIGQTEGTIYFEGSSDTIGASTNLINFNFAPNSVVINRQSTGVIRAVINTTASSIILNSSPVSGIFKAAIGYKNGDSVLYVNGTLAASSTNSFTFAAALTEVNLGTGISYFAAVNQSKCNQALLFPTRLSNADLAALTA